MADERDSYLRWREASQTPTGPQAALDTNTPQERYQAFRQDRDALAAERAALLIEQAVPAADAAAAFGRAEEAQRQGMLIAPDLLSNAQSELARRIEAQTRRTQLMSSSRLAGWVVQDPMNAALAQTELQNLSTAAGLFNSLQRGFDRTVTGWWNRRRVRNAEDDLTDLQNRIADRDRSLGSIVDDVQAQLTIDDFDMNPGVTVTRTYASALGRFISSRLTFVGDESLQRYETTLTKELDRALQMQAENTQHIEQSYGRSARVARVDQALADIGEIQGVGEQLSALGALMAEEPAAFTEWLANVVVESAPGLTAGAATTYATRSPAAGAAVLGTTSYVTGEATTFDQFVREAGYDLTDPGQRAALVADPALRQLLRDRAFAYGAVVGLVDAASGGVASRTFTSSPAGELVLQAVTQAVMGGGGEALGQLASGQDLNMVEIMVEGLAEFATAPVEIAGVGGRYLRDRRLVEQDRAFFNALAQSAEESQMRQQVPERYRSAIEALTQDGPVENLHIDAQSLDELFQSDPNGVTAEQFLQAVPGVDLEAYRRALDTGSTIEIPTASYASDIVGTRFDEIIREHLRTDPARMSAAELRSYREQLKELTDQAQRAADNAESGQTELERVAEEARVELVSSLRRAGRTRDVAEAEALQAVAFARTTAKRLGIELTEFLQRYPLADVQGALESTVEVGTPRVTAEVLDRVRAPAAQRDGESDLIEAMRAAAEAADLDLATAEPVDLERAVEQMYGPAAGPVLLNQLEQRLATPASLTDLQQGITPEFLRRPGWGVVTAARNTAADEAQNAALEAELQRRGIAYRKMEGVYRGQSDGASFMIFADRETVVELGRMFQQESVLTRDGLVFMDGGATIPLAPNDLAIGDTARTRDFYSVMDDGTVWSAGFTQELTQAPLYDRTAIEARARELETELQPLPGAPRVEGASGPDPMLNAVAEAYALANNIPYARQAEFVAVDEARAKRIADAYEAMPHTPDSMVTRNAYEKLIAQTRAQYDALVAAGYEFWFFDPKNDPYNGNPWNAMRELRKDRRMAVYPTEDGYGSGATELDTTDNPLLVDTGLRWSFGERGSADLRRVTANDLFRAVHDAFGHGIEGAGFRARGEENAWQAHARLFTGWAVAALTTETRGQNSWLNYGPHGEKNRTAAVDETVFADQKAGIMPDWTWTEGKAADYVPSLPVNEDGTITLTHWSGKALTTIDPKHAGTGPLKGAERNRRGPRKVFFGVNVGKPGGYRKENLGPYRHEVRIAASDLYDLARDPLGLIDAIPEKTPNLQRIGWVEEQIKEKGFKGYVVMDSPLGATAAVFEAVEPVSVRDDRTLELFQSGATPDFFSALTREVENAKQAKAQPSDWKAIIQKLPGVKKAEIEWSGVFEWLDAQEGPVARETVAAFLRDNEVEVETVVLTEDGGASMDDFSVDFPSYGDTVEPDDAYITDTAEDIYLPDLIDQHVDMMNESDDYEGDSWTADDISESDMAALREQAEELARDAYYEDPEYTYDVTVTMPDGSERNEVVTQSSGGEFYWGDDSYMQQYEVEDAIREQYEEEARDQAPDGDTGTKWGEYKERGGEQYREVLLTVPFLEDRGPNRLRDTRDRRPFVNDSHYEKPNIVVHARIDYRKAADGSKVLFVEEVQSDLGSYWRENGGVPSPAELAKFRRASERAAEIRAEAQKVRDEQAALAEQILTGQDLTFERPSDGARASTGMSAVEIIRKLNDYRNGDYPLSMLQSPFVSQVLTRLDAALPRPGQDGFEDMAALFRLENKLGVLGDEMADVRDRMMLQRGEPFTPFEGEAYYALMMKRLLKLAAEEGADRIAWTPAYMQARRWSGAVQNVLNEVQWDDRYTWVAEDGSTGDARQVTLRGVNGDDVFLVDADGVIREKARDGGRIPEADVVGKPLADLIGGTMARRVLEEPTGVISGQNIVVGGDGYKISYDQQIKKFVEKFAKKYGSRVTVDKTMPDFVTGSNSTPVARIVAQYGYENVQQLLRESALRSPEFWASYDKEFEQSLADSRRRAEDMLKDNENELARIDRNVATLREISTPEAAERRAAQGARLLEMTEERRRQVEAFDDPANVAATWYRHLINRRLLTEQEVVSVLPDEVKPQGDAVWSVDITPEMRTAASEAQPLFQRRPDGARGSILLPTEPGRAPLVTLFPKADLSTFLHESGHYYLHVLQDINAKGDAPAGMTADWETIRRWWGQNVENVAKDGDVTQAQVRSYLRNGTTGDIDIDRKVNVGLQEQWARAYEAYLLEGKAPSNALRSAFEAFSAWLLSVYRRARGLNVEINDELRGVFDRLLATDEEIAAATTENGFDALVAQSAEQLGIDEAEYQKLVKLSAEAQDEARQQLLLDVMAPIRRARTEEYRAERAEVEAGIRAQVNAKPANRVREWLGNGRWLGDGEPQELPGELRLDRQLLIEEHGEDTLNALPRGRYPLWKAGTGLSADDVAGWFGYKSGSAMLQDLMTTPRAEDEIRSRTEAEMRKRHGDPLGDGSIEAAAVEALHGEKRGQLLAAELRAIGKAAKRGKVTTRSQAAEIARKTIRQMPIRKAVRSGQYLAAERRAGERAALAVARGDMDEAFAAKREQLLNHQLYVESRKADEILAKVESRVAKLKKKSVRQNLAGEYLEAIDDILTSYDFRKSVTQRQARRRAGLQAYVEMMKAAGRENELAIPSYVLDEAKRRPYKTLPVAELEGVLDSLRNIEHTARMKQKLRDAQRERELTAVVGDIVQEMDANLKDNAPNRVATPGEKAKAGLREFANLLLNADTLLRKIGGFDRGNAYDAIKAPIDDAADWASVERAKAAEAFENIYDVYSKREQRRMAVRRHYPELGGAFTKWDLISAALNMGNADNLARLMDKDSGGGFNASQVEFIKQQLDKRDWDFVQSAWEMVNSYWPLIEARERRLTGVAPKKVQATEVETPYGTYAGGYYPIRYRGDVSGMVAAEELAEVQQRMMAGRFGKAQTRNGHLEERAQGSGGRVLQLGMEVMHQHIGQVIHDLAFSEAVANSWRILQDPRVRGTFERKGLLKDHQALEMWLQDTATGQLAAGGVFGRLALRAKNGFTLSKLAFNLSTVAIQLTGITQSVAVLGSRNMAIGYSTYLSNPVRTSREVVALSPFMAERETTFNRDINDILGDVMVGPAASRYQRFQQGLARVGFWLMQKVQFYGVDVPTWYAGYHQGLQKFGNDEAKARSHADRMVARAQASGVFSDRSAFERGTLSSDTRQNGFVRLFTALGSYMFAKGNVAYEVYGRTRRDVTGANLKSLQAAIRGATDMALLFTVEAIAYHLIKGTLPGMGDDGDDKDWATFLARETLLSMMSTVPGIRDVGSSLSGFEAGAYGSVIETFTRPMLQAAQGEADMALFKALSNAAGVATGMPSGQLNRIADAWYRLEEGEDVSPVEFIMGRR